MQLKGWTLCVASAALATMIGQATAEPAKSHPFNGDWKVALVTETGMCGSALQYGIAIENGSINSRRADASDSTFNVFGRVDRGGRVRVTLVKGTARAAAIGQLKLASGSGTWQLPTLGCAGRWSAARL